MAMTPVPEFHTILHQAIQFDIMHRTMVESSPSALAAFIVNKHARSGSSGSSGPNTGHGGSGSRGGGGSHQQPSQQCSLRGAKILVVIPAATTTLMEVVGVENPMSPGAKFVVGNTTRISILNSLMSDQFPLLSWRKRSMPLVMCLNRLLVGTWIPVY